MERTFQATVMVGMAVVVRRKRVLLLLFFPLAMHRTMFCVVFFPFLLLFALVGCPVVVCRRRRTLSMRRRRRRCIVVSLRTPPMLSCGGFLCGSAPGTVGVIVVGIVLTTRHTFRGDYRSIIFGKDYRRPRRPTLRGICSSFSATMRTMMGHMRFSTIVYGVYPFSSVTFSFFSGVVLAITPVRARGGGKGRGKGECRGVHGIRDTRGIGKRRRHHHAIKARERYRCPFVSHG